MPDDKAFLWLLTLALAAWLALIVAAVFLVCWTGNPNWGWLIASPFIAICLWGMYRGL
jgi:hypothetical protein